MRARLSMPFSMIATLSVHARTRTSRASKPSVDAHVDGRLAGDVEDRGARHIEHVVERRAGDRDGRRDAGPHRDVPADVEGDVELARAGVEDAARRDAADGAHGAMERRVGQRVDRDVDRPVPAATFARSCSESFAVTSTCDVSITSAIGWPANVESPTRKSGIAAAEEDDSAERLEVRPHRDEAVERRADA